MAQLLVCFMLANVFAAAAMASTDQEKVQAMIQPELGSSSPSPSPAQAPKRKAQIARKLGAPPPSLPDHSDTKESQSHSAEETSAEEATVGSEESKSGAEHHRPFDKSVAGGGVILGGLATTFLVAIFCYIRATRRHGKAATTPESPLHHQLP